MTYEKIIAPLGRIVANLDKYREKNKARENELTAQLEFIKRDIDDSKLEAAKAEAASKKISNLFK